MTEQRSSRSGDAGPGRWTIQFMPDGGGRVHTIRLSRRALNLAAVAVATFAGLLFGVIASLSVGTVRHAELIRLQTENEHLQRDLTEIQGQVRSLGHSVDALSVRDQQFRLLAGLPHIDEDVRAVGIGGPSTWRSGRRTFVSAAPETAERTFATAYDVGKLVRRAELLTASVEEAIDSLEVHRDVLLARPSIRPVKSDEAWISSAFSGSRYHPVLQFNRPHPGIDISAHAGTPIRATARGVVTYASSKAGYGKTIEVDHGFGYKTRYAHAGAINVKRGERVERGHILGEVGRSGLATAPHLHYEVLIDGRPVNPRTFFLDELIYE